MRRAQAILRVASWLAPREIRSEWLREWQSELWYIPPKQAVRFCVGAFQDALWVRRHTPRTVRPLLESPFRCLAALSCAAILALAVSACLPAAPLPPPAEHLRPRDFLAGCAMMLVFSCLILAVIRLIVGPTSYYCRPSPGGQLRRSVFLALKILLVQPVLLCGFIVLLLTGPLVPFVPQLGIFSFWALTLRWVLLDQRRRCPVCLRLLTEPVRIGSASETFLEWYGGESLCRRGHGLLQAPEIAASYSGAQRWLDLDDSWKELFPAEGRQ